MTGERRGRVLACVRDLLFSSRIEATLGSLGYVVDVVEGLEGLAAGLSRGRPEIVILDLHGGTAARQVVDLARPAGVPVLAFGRHTEPGLLRGARRAGCAAVVARSTFVEEMAELVRRVAEAGRATPAPGS